MTVLDRIGRALRVNSFLTLIGISYIIFGMLDSKENVCVRSFIR